MKKLWMFFVLIVLFSGCSSTSIPDRLEVEEYAVYNALIESMYCGSQFDLIVIRDHTEAYPSDEEMSRALKYVNERMPELEQRTLSDYETKNESPCPLSYQFKLQINYVLISDKEINSIFAVKQRGWKDFYSSYAGSQGIMTLARVGLNSNKNQALVYIGNQRDWLVGEGWYILLLKDNDQWVIKYKVMIYIS